VLAACVCVDVRYQSHDGRSFFRLLYQLNHGDLLLWVRKNLALLSQRRKLLLPLKTTVIRNIFGALSLFSPRLLLSILLFVSFQSLRWNSCLRKFPLHDNVASGDCGDIGEVAVFKNSRLGIKASNPFSPKGGQKSSAKGGDWSRNSCCE